MSVNAGNKPLHPMENGIGVPGPPCKVMMIGESFLFPSINTFCSYPFNVNTHNSDTSLFNITSFLFIMSPLSFKNRNFNQL